MYTQSQQWLAQAVQQLAPDSSYPAPRLKPVWSPIKGVEREPDAASSWALERGPKIGVSPGALAGRLAADFNKLAQGRASASATPAGHVNISFERVALVETGDQMTQGALGSGKQLAPMIVEFVSSNPTGPLHAGHGRGAALGWALVSILKHAGHPVSAEYYMNDAGRQVKILGLSCVWASLTPLGLPSAPKGSYLGGYVKELSRDLIKPGAIGSQIELAAALKESAAAWEQRQAELASLKLSLSPEDLSGFEKGVEKERDAFIDASAALCERFWPQGFGELCQSAASAMGELNLRELSEIGVAYDVVFSEKTLWDSGAIEALLTRMEGEGSAYRQGEALMFKASAYGDEKDRVLRRSNGQPTYFAADLAYHANKLSRCGSCLNVWGSDHHGYAPRLLAGLSALGFDASALTVRLAQFASLKKNGQTIQMSTRAGNFLPLGELVDELGQDGFFWWMNSKKPESHVEIDMAKAAVEGKANPVFSAQYAGARLSQAIKRLPPADSESLAHAGPLAARLLAKGALFENAFAEALSALSPQPICDWIQAYSAVIHSAYESERFDQGSVERRGGWAFALGAARGQLSLALGLLGVSAPLVMPQLDRAQSPLTP